MTLVRHNFATKLPQNSLTAKHFHEKLQKSYKTGMQLPVANVGLRTNRRPAQFLML